MADQAEELTPEEKLLKVIQDDGEQADEAAVSSEPTAAATPVESEAVAEEQTPPVEEDGGKPKLKLAGKQSAASGESESPADAAAASEDTPRDETAGEARSSAAAIAAGPVVAGGAIPGANFGLSTANRCLAAVVLIMVGFAVYEIWASIQMPSYAGAVTSELPDAVWINTEPVLDPVPIDDILKAFEDPIIGRKEVAEIKDGAKPQPKSPIDIYIKEHLNLIGLSSGEAIIVDNKIEKMHFKRVGDKITINGTEVEVVEITAEYVTVADGDRQIRVE